jgi:hypothetical protein
MIERLRASNEWKFVGAAQRGSGLAAPLVLVAVVFVLLQVLSPIHQAIGANLGSRTAAWLYDRLASACVRPPGMGHLESPALTSDLTMARDFDLGITGPPMSISMGFIAGGLVEMVGGLASAVLLAGYAWWAPLLLAGAWLATHWLLRESGVWRDRNTDEVREAQRHADYAYRLAVEPPAAKELRLFGLADWTVDRFRSRRHLFELQWKATRLRRASRSLEPAAGARRERRRVLVLGRRRGRRPSRARQTGHVCERSSEHEHDRVRRALVGARRSRCARRGRRQDDAGEAPVPPVPAHERAHPHRRCRALADAA